MSEFTTIRELKAENARLRDGIIKARRSLHDGLPEYADRHLCAALPACNGPAATWPMPEAKIEGGVTLDGLPSSESERAEK